MWLVQAWLIHNPVHVLLSHVTNSVWCPPLLYRITPIAEVHCALSVIWQWLSYHNARNNTRVACWRECMSPWGVISWLRGTTDGMTIYCVCVRTDDEVVGAHYADELCYSTEVSVLMWVGVKWCIVFNIQSNNRKALHLRHQSTKYEYTSSACPKLDCKSLEVQTNMIIHKS